MICKDCGYVLHQIADKAVGSGEWTYLWGNLRGDWTCPLTGDEHVPVPDENMQPHWEVAEFGSDPCEKHRWFTNLVARGDALDLGMRECETCGQAEVWIRPAEEAIEVKG